MKTYIEHKTHINIGDLWIPKDLINCDYQQFLQEQKKGEAKLVQYVSPLPTWDDIKVKRNQLLIESDWTGIEDATPKPNKEAWLNYRQALRDVPQNFSTPESVVWPTKPS